MNGYIEIHMVGFRRITKLW